jgi:type IV pilus assembly protein PilO
MNVREPNVQKGIMGIILVIALVWLIFFTSYLPFSHQRTASRLQELRAELQQVAGELQRLESAAKRLPRIKMELAALQRKWEVLRGLLPRASEMSALLSGITTAGMTAGVQFSLFEPGEPEPFELYTKYPIRVSVMGGYHQVGRFFDNICNMQRLVGISQLGVAQLSKGEEVKTVEASATLAAYTYNEEPPATAVKPGTQTGENDK